MTQASCVYEGYVRHRRREPISHEFSYKLFMLYLDLDELPTLFTRRWFWSARAPSLAWFRRRDRLGDPSQPLDECVRSLVEAKTGRRPTGPVRLLTHLRYAGFVINPISVFYCFDESGRVTSFVADVTNTPWGERHLYVLPAEDSSVRVSRPTAVKQLHVSPFMTMDYVYEFRLTTPGRSLAINISNPRPGNDRSTPLFDASAIFRRREMTGPTLARLLCQYPLMTAQVALAIYWQAFRLWWKGAPYVPHPKTVEVRNAVPAEASS